MRDLDEADRYDCQGDGDHEGKPPRDCLVLVLIRVDVEVAEAVGLLVDGGVVEDSRLEVRIERVPLACSLSACHVQCLEIRSVRLVIQSHIHVVVRAIEGGSGGVFDEELNDK